MKRYFLIFLVIASAALFSCTKDVEWTEPETPGEGIILQLEPTGMELSTKANTDPTRPGDFDGQFNEKKFNSKVDIFFFRSATNLDAQSVYHKRVSVSALGVVQLPISAADIVTIFGSSIQNAVTYALVVANYDGIDHSRNYTVNEILALDLPVATFNTVFPQDSFIMLSNDQSTDSPLVKVILTAPNSATPATGTIPMKRIAAKISFRLTVANEIKVVNVVRDQSGFVTDRRLETWTPQTTAMTAYLFYGMKVGKLSGEPQTPPATVPLASVPETHATLFQYQARNLATTNETIPRTRTPIIGLNENVDPPVPIPGDEITENFPVYQVVAGPSDNRTAGPFYTYPVTWSPGAAGEPFIKLIIPWNNGQRTKYYYYKIPFKKAPLASNHWYEVTLDVQILGGEEADPVPLEASYKVVPWVDGETAFTQVETARYLSVPKTEWIMYNTEELTIPITSSHDVQIVGYQVKGSGTAKGNAFAEKDKYDDDREPLSDTWIGTDPQIYNPFTNTRYSIDNTTTVGTIYATRPNYKANNSGDPYPANSNATSWFPEAKITRDEIVFEHALNNDTSGSDYDIAPYYVRIRVQHKDDTDYYRDIIIEQRPAIVIEAQKNSYPNNDTKGYAYVNNSSISRRYNGNNSTYRHYSSGRDYYDYYLGGDPQNREGTMNNTNWNMYIIETSVLPTTGSLKDYVLSDPRSQDVDVLNSDLPSNWSVSAPFVGKTASDPNRSLTNYYPVMSTAVAENYIAPKYRIASSYGACRPVLYEDALRRCASYQEDGYPAGRWRVPTKAELMYMAKLTADGKIPRLLGSDTTNPTYSYYWCNDGYVKIRNGSSDAPTFEANTSVSLPQTYNGDASENGLKNVRCVYDEWYWENTQYERVNKTTFTWGDQLRENVVRTKAVKQ